MTMQVRFWLAAPVLASLLACIPEMRAAKAPSFQPPEEGETVTAVDTSSPDTVPYSPEGKRDPFAGRETSQTRHLDLGELRLVFTNTGTSSPMAVVMDAQNRSRTLHIGDFLGQRWGRVSAIHRDAITISELYASNDGRTFSQDVTLRMTKDEMPGLSGREEQ